MKKLLVGLLALGSLSAFADVRLSPGESIYIGGEVVRCGGAVEQPTPGFSRFSNLPWNQLEALLKQGLGNCRLEMMGGLMHFFSNRDRAFPVNVSRQQYVRDAVKNGDCD